MNLRYDLEGEIRRRGFVCADWILKMRRFYDEHGYFRAEDLLRALGDVCRGVSIPLFPINSEEIRRRLENNV